VELYEFEFLKCFDFEKYFPDFMLIEVLSGEDIETIITPFYKPIAALNISDSYSDILYQARKLI